MARIRERVSKSLFKVETTEGVDSAPDGTFFHRIIEGSTYSMNPEIIDNSELRGGAGAGEHIVGALLPTATLRANIRTSGVAGIAPETDDLLRVCGFVKTTVTALPAGGPTTATSGTSRTVVVPVGTDWPASTAAGLYLKGYQVSIAGNPTVAEIEFIVDYSVTSTNATITLSGTHSPALSSATTIQVIQQVVYKSESPNPHPSGSSYLYLDGILQKLFGVRGTWSEEWTGRKNGITQFDLSGFYGGRFDVAMLTGETDDVASPQAWINGIARINGRTICGTSMRASLNWTGAYPTCPEATYGVDAYQDTARGFRLTIDPDLALVATADNVASLLAGTIMPVAFLLGPRTGGTAAIGRHGLVVPSAKLRGVGTTTVDGVRKDQLEFGSTLVDDEVVLSYS